jgi:hypothetical protein
MTDEAINMWIAAHYGVTIDNIPTSRPQDMCKNIYELLKK